MVACFPAGDCHVHVDKCLFSPNFVVRVCAVALQRSRNEREVCLPVYAQVEDKKITVVPNIRIPFDWYVIRVRVRIGYKIPRIKVKSTMASPEREHAVSSRADATGSSVA